MTQLELNTFLKFRSLSNLETSPNNTYISFVSAQMREDKNDYIHSLHIRKGSKTSRVLNLKNNGRYYWESDQTILYFNETTAQEKKDKKNRHTIVYRLNVETKKSEFAYTFPFPVSSLQVLDDSLILNAQLNEKEHAYFENDSIRDAFIKDDIANKDFEEITSIPFYSDGGTFTRQRISQSFVYKNGKYIPLGSKSEAIAHITVADNSIYYTVAQYTGIPSYYANLRKMDLNTFKTTDITTDSKYSYSKLFVLNNTLYFLGSDKKTYGMNQNGDFYKVIDGTVTKVIDFGLSSSNTMGSDVRYGSLVNARTFNDKYYFVGSYHHHSVIYKFDGEIINQYKVSSHSIDSFTFTNNDIYSIEITEKKPQELYKNHACISKFNDAVLKNIYISSPIHHTITNDGVTLDGWVLLPQDYDENRKYPSILNIHGGPKTIYSSIFYNEMQVWANKGFIVYFMNPRGGDCYDNEFADIRGKYGTIDYQDLMTFTDLVLDKYSLDPLRMGVTGGSYGGFMTNWIVGHTDRFSAAATQRSISNWTSFAGTSDIGSYFAQDQTAADPITELDLAWKQSPLQYADNIKTPLLFIHSDQDYRCPIEQAMQLYSRVRKNNVETKFIWFKQECHDLSRSGRPQSRVKRLNEITLWMEHYLTK